MTRFSLTCAIVIAAALAPARAALADDKPTPEQMDQAKAAFAEGKALHDAGKLPEAIDKFKESYRLSKRPVLLYNIALTMDEAKQDLALFYYQKYLTDAPATDANRPAAMARVKDLEAAALGGPSTPTPPVDPTKPPVDTTPKPPVDTTPKPVAIKPIGTYKAEDFQHQIVEEAPPGKPLDVSASVPPDSGWMVTLYYRAAGESKFTAKPMKWRYKELVARIPPATMSGSAIQYYVEAKEQNGEVVTRAGKSTSPNLVNIDEKASPRFYPDLDDAAVSTAAQQKHQDDDDPLRAKRGPKQTPDEPIGPSPTPGEPGQGFGDVGSKKFGYAKWGATGGAVAMFGLSTLFFVQAKNQADALKLDTSTDAHGNPCTAPCHPFDSFDSGIQSAGKRDQTFANVTFGVGVAAGVVAGYFWYRELKGHHSKSEKVPASNGNGVLNPDASAMTWMIGPTAGDGVTGAAAMGKF